MRPVSLALLWLLALPLTAQEVKPTEGYLARFTRTVAPATRAVVPLQVQFPAGSKLSSYPVTFGVPFPRGAVASAARMRLLENGQAIAAHIQRTATWHHRNGDVKWVLIDATVKPGAKYALEYGSAVQALNPKPALSVTESPELVTVNTGSLQFVVSRKQAGLLHSVTDARGNPLIAAGQNPPPALTDAKGVVYPLSATDEYEVTVEQAGPLHAIIKTAGWYCAPDGTRFCQHLSRLHAYAGQAALKLEHTFVIAFDTDTNQIRDIALPLQLTGQRPRATFALEAGRQVTATGPAYLLQDAHDRCTVRDATGKELGAGGRAQGWADLSGAQGGLTVGLRRFWQEFPRELEVRGNGLIVHLWPPHGEKLLDFDARAVLGPQRYQEWDRVFWSNWYKGGLDKYDQAFGLAKSNDLMLVFHETPEPAAELCRTLDEPVIVTASPQWMCASDVAGMLSPADPQRFPADEKRFKLGLYRFQWLREHLANWGLIDYGDVNYNLTHDAASGNWSRSGWRCWGSRFYGHPVMPWIQFLRTADREFLDWAQDNTRHVMDIDMAHLTNTALKPYERRRGGRHGGNSGILHYAADMYPIGCDSHVDQLLLQYYLTGYRRAWDVLEEEADYYLWEDSQPNRQIHRYAHRMTGGALRTMTDLYNATWDERYLQIARKQADLCYGAQNAEGVIRHDDVYMAPGLFRYYQASGDERMKALFLRCMRYQSKVGRDDSDPRSFGFYGLSMAYFLTGDPSYLPWAERWREEFHKSVQDVEDPTRRGQALGNWDYAYLTLHQFYMPYYLQALAALNQPVKAVSLDVAITNGNMVLARETDKPFALTAEWYLYDNRYCSGVSIKNFDRYLQRRPLKARLAVWDAQGREVAAAPLTTAAGEDELNPELRPSGGDPRSGKVSVNVPAGAPGLYRVGLTDADGLHLKLRLASCDLGKWAYDTTGSYLAAAGGYYFPVAPQAESFALGVKTLALRKQVQYTLLDPAGQVVRQETLSFGSSPAGKYTVWTVPVPPAHRGKLWQLQIDPVQAAIEQTYFSLDGRPVAVWTDPEAYFPLDLTKLAAPAVAAAPAEPYPGAGPSLRIAPGKPLQIPRGAARPDGSYEKLDPRRGTLEFWFRPEWADDDISDQTIAACGKLHLYRRSRVGTYVLLNTTSQSGFVTEPGTWYHLALTWDDTPAQGQPRVRLFINGVDLTGTVLGDKAQALGDWTGELLSLGGEVGCAIDDLRVSRTVRYKGDFTPPSAAALADADTLLLQAF